MNYKKYYSEHYFLFLWYFFPNLSLLWKYSTCLELNEVNKQEKTNTVSRHIQEIYIYLIILNNKENKLKIMGVILFEFSYHPPPPYFLSFEIQFKFWIIDLNLQEYLTLNQLFMIRRKGVKRPFSNSLNSIPGI